MTNKKALIILFFIVILGGALRFYKLGERPFINDEFFDVNASYGYLQTGKFVNWDFNLNRLNPEGSYPSRDERTWVYRWQVAELLRVLPPTEAVFRSVSVIWGLISIIALYFVGKYFTGQISVGLISAFIFAVNASGLVIDRRIRMYAMFFPVFLIFSWLLYRFYEEKYEGKNEFLKKIQYHFDMNFKWLLPMLAVGLLSLHLQELTVNIVPIFAAYISIMALVMLIKNKSIVNRIINKYTVSLFLMAAGAVAAKFLFPGLINELLDRVKFFMHSYEYLVNSDYNYAEIGYLFTFLGFCYLGIKLKRPKEALWLALSAAVVLFLAVFLWKRDPSFRYIHFARSFEIMLISTGIVGFAKMLSDPFKKFNKVIFAVLVILLMAGIPSHQYLYGDSDIYGTYARGEMHYRNVFDYIAQNKKDGDAMITRDFRSYYMMNWQMPIANLGVSRADKSFSTEDVKKMISQYPRVWVVLTERDDFFISDPAKKFIKDNFQNVSINSKKGDGKVYLWERGMQMQTQ
jgi:hypothetical protein